MVSLSATPDVRAQWRDAGRQTLTGLAWILWAAGWLVAKTVRLIIGAVAAVIFALGWVAGRVVWPAACWAGRAVRLGWDEGRKPRQRGAEAA